MTFPRFSALTYHISGLVVELPVVGEPCHRPVERVRGITLRTVLYIYSNNNQ